MDTQTNACGQCRTAYFRNTPPRAASHWKDGIGLAPNCAEGASSSALDAVCSVGRCRNQATRSKK